MHMLNESIKLALGNIGRTKLRHFLTMCGIMIGTGAIVSMVSFAVGMRNEMSRTVASSGLLTTIYVLPSGGGIAGLAPGMDEHDPDDTWAGSDAESERDSGAEPRTGSNHDRKKGSGPDETAAREPYLRGQTERGPTAGGSTEPGSTEPESAGLDSTGRESARRGPIGPGPQITDDVITRIGSIKGVTSAFPIVAFPAIVSHGPKQAFGTVAGMPSGLREATKKRLEKGEVFSSESDSTLLVSAMFARRLGIDTDSIDTSSFRKGIPVRMTIVTLRGTLLGLSGITGQSATGRSFSPLAMFGMQMPFERRSIRFHLKGVLKDSFFGPVGRADCYIPLSMAKDMASMTIQDPSQILRNPSLGRGGYLGAEVHVSDLSGVENVAREIRAMNLTALSISDQLKGMRTAFMLVSAFLGAIGGVALFVGCLGIVNVMLISVLERTREIGIMKSVGARRKDILHLFVAEAAIIGVVGGLLGIVLGWFVAEVTNHVMFTFIIKNEAPFQRLYEIPFWLAAGAVCLAVFVSIVAGLYPARRAAGLEPTAALRYE